MNSSLPVGPRAEVPTYEIYSNLNSPISQETELASWLVAIESHGRTGSAESQKSLIKLAKTLPDHQSMPQDVQDGIIEITQLLQQKEWAPELSPQSSKLLQKICRDYSPESQQKKPACIKKLEFI
ncbi:MAG: hypothetical protein H0T62_11005 [Parachlamydiaceae bacterium]|nr:hypothetical protein [Parachlamydiaceae bacterium]